MEAKELKVVVRPRMWVKSGEISPGGDSPSLIEDVERTPPRRGAFALVSNRENLLQFKMS
jgi:hypothetical protein